MDGAGFRLGVCGAVSGAGDWFLPTAAGVDGAGVWNSERASEAAAAPLGVAGLVVEGGGVERNCDFGKEGRRCTVAGV